MNYVVCYPTKLMNLFGWFQVLYSLNNVHLNVMDTNLLYMLFQVFYFLNNVHLNVMYTKFIVYVVSSFIVCPIIVTLFLKYNCTFDCL